MNQVRNMKSGLCRRQMEIVVHVNNKPASVAEVMVAASAPPVEILASCFYWEHDGTVVRLVTEDPQRTRRALASAGFLCQTDSILLLGPYNQPGVVTQAAARLAAVDIGVVYSYVSWSERTGTFAALKTTDDDRALRVLEVNAMVDDLVLARVRPRRQAETMNEPLSAKMVA